MIFIVLSSLETVQYRYCIFSLLYRLLTLESLTFIRTKERKYIVNVQCSVQHTL